MSTTADRIAATVARIRPVAEDLALPDQCVVWRSDSGTVDSRGNAVPGEYRAGGFRCQLRTSRARVPREGAQADRVQSVAAMEIAAPIEGDITPEDVIEVNGTRRFEVIGVAAGGEFGVFQIASVEERT